MARNSKVTTKKRQDHRPRPDAAGSGRPRRGRPKVCLFCSEHAAWVDYKDVALLKRFVNDRGRLKARGATGTCAQHQRDVATAVKTARELVLLPYVVRTVSAEGRRGQGGDRRGNGGPARGASAPGPAEADGSTAEPDGSAAEPDGSTPGGGSAAFDQAAERLATAQV